MEALLSLVILSLISLVVSSVYITGLQAYDVQAEHVLVSSQLRSKMEYLLSFHFDTLVSGNENVVINGENLVLSWTVVNEDMTGDSIADATAKRVTVTLAGRTLTTLVADTTDQVFKL